MSQPPDRSSLAPFGRLVGRWTTEATHPAMPGVIVHGSADIEWLEGERFLILRARTDHPKFPDSISVIGHTDDDRVDDATGATPDASPNAPVRMHYFDSRGVYRVLESSFTDNVWRVWRDARGFSQRFAGTFSADGDTIDGLWQLRRDDVHWADDLKITYRRRR